MATIISNVDLKQPSMIKVKLMQSLPRDEPLLVKTLKKDGVENSGLATNIHALASKTNSSDKKETVVSFNHFNDLSKVILIKIKGVDASVSFSFPLTPKDAVNAQFLAVSGIHGLSKYKDLCSLVICVER